MQSRPTTLQDRLHALRVAFESGPTPSEDIQILDDHVLAMQKGGFAERALQGGEQAPNFSMRSTCGRTLSLAELLKNGPVILTWFRGNW